MVKVPFSLSSMFKWADARSGPLQWTFKLPRGGWTALQSTTNSLWENALPSSKARPWTVTWRSGGVVSGQKTEKELILEPFPAVWQDPVVGRQPGPQTVQGAVFVHCNGPSA